MKSKISIITMFFLAFFTLSSFAPMSAPVVAPAVTSAVTAEAPKADKKARLMQKLLTTKAGRWAVRKMQAGMEKRNAKLSTKLAIAEKAGDVKKVDRIKKQMATKGLVKTGIWLLVGGLIAIIIGFVMAAGAATSGSASGFGLGALVLYLGWLCFLVGGVVLIIGLVKS